jgi:hypothetical protein
VRNWDAESLAELSQADFFREGFDCERLLRDALDAQIEELGGLYENGALLDEASARAEKERVIAGLRANGVNIGSERMTFVASPQTDASGSDGAEVRRVELAYRDIGYENLRLFD